jgi:uncharacterized membrane protein
MLAAEGFELVFRTIHIMFAVAWAGSAFLFAVFIEPAAFTLGPAAEPFMQETAGRRKAPEFITAIAAVAVLGGWVLWFDDMLDVGFSDWIGSAFGVWMTIGGVAATAAFFAGLIGIPPNIRKLTAIGEEVAAGGGTPTPEQAARMATIQRNMQRLSRIDLALLGVAVFAMATARYW